MIHYVQQIPPARPLSGSILDFLRAAWAICGMQKVDVTVPDGPIYFISDAHLGSPAGPVERESWLLDLMEDASQNARAVFIVGDLFDFWFEYKSAVPKCTVRIAHAITNCIQRGVAVYFLGGNHDFWAGDYLAAELGVHSFDGPIYAELQGRRVYLAHGDGLGPGDGGYKILKTILRHPWAIAAYRSLHPDFGIPFATFASTKSRGTHQSPRDVIVPKVVRDIARPQLQGDTSAMLMGHVHEPSHFEENGKEFLLIGDWLEVFTHVRMENGKFALYKRKADGSHEVVPSEPFPPAPPR